MRRSWLSARASMVPTMPPADAPAMMSTTTRRSTVAADLAQQLEIELLGVVFGIARGRSGRRTTRCSALRAIGNAVQRARRPHQLQDFLADAVHVDGERNAAEAHQRNAKFLLAHGVRPPSQGDSRATADHVPDIASRRKPYSIAVAGLDPHRRIALALAARAKISSRMRAVARLDRDVELGALGRHVEEQPAVVDLEDVGAELAEPCRDLAEHARPVGDGQPERHDPVARARARAP